MKTETWPLDTQDAEVAFDLIASVFARDSSIHKALKIAEDEYRDYLRPSFLAMTDEGHSLVAKSRSGKVLGCLVATDAYSGSAFVDDASDKFAPISALTRALLASSSFRSPETDGEVLLVDMAAVAPEARGRGLYRRLRIAIEAHAKAQGFQRIIGELSSVETQAVVLQEMGHRSIAEIAFDAFEHRGTFPFARIEVPKKIVLSEQIL